LRSELLVEPMKGMREHQFAAYQRARVPREGRKSRRRRRDKRADRPFAKIKKLFTKIKRLI
jgi:hypothetical protein